MMYPGTETSAWMQRGSEAGSIDGVGAVPVVPGEEQAELLSLLSGMLGLAVPHGKSF